MALIEDFLKGLFKEKTEKADSKEIDYSKMWDNDVPDDVVRKYRHQPEVTEKQIQAILNRKDLQTDDVVSQLLLTDYAKINNVSENILNTPFKDIKPIHLLIAKFEERVLLDELCVTSECIHEIKHGRPEITGYHDGLGGLGVDRQEKDLIKRETQLQEIEESLSNYEKFINTANQKFSITHDDFVKYNKIDSELQKVGVNILNIKGEDLERLGNSQMTKNIIPISFSLDGVTIQTDAFLSLKEKNDGSLSLKIHAIVNDQERIRSIAKSDNGVETVFGMFYGDEDKALNFLKRNNLLESFAPVSSLYFETLDRNMFIGNYLDGVNDRGEAIEQAKKDYAIKTEQLEILDKAFRNECASFNIVKGVELEPAQIRELRHGKTIEVPGLLDDKGEKYAGFIHLNLTDAQIKEFKTNPSQAINLRKMAVVTPKHDYKVQVAQNNHGMKTEQNKFAKEHVKSGDAVSKDLKDVVGKISFLGAKGEVGEVNEYMDKESYLNAIKKEMDYNPDGFRYQTLSNEPELKKAADDIVYGAYGAENPKTLDWYSSAVNDTKKTKVSNVNFNKNQKNNPKNKKGQRL